MSIYPLTRVWDHSRQRGTALLLLLAMADRADELGVCWAGTNWLAGRARLARRQTIRTVQLLEQAKEIVVVRSRRPSGQNVVNHYIVSVGAPPDVMFAAQGRVRELLAMRGSVVHDTSAADDTREGGQDDTREGGQDDTRVVAGMTPDPSSYPEDKDDTLLSFSELWQEALDELEMQMTKGTFERHLRGTTASGWAEDDVLLVITPRPTSLEWLNVRLRELIERNVHAVAGRPVAVRFEVRS